MTDQHPITPPPELVEQWHSNSPLDRGLTLATRAAQWGADQELEACCKWMKGYFLTGSLSCNQLRAARRPKPPSLKELALEQLNGIATCFLVTHGGDLVCDKIRAALEALPND